jgi:hypothetical protein
MPGRLPTGRRHYSPADLEPALEHLLGFSHEPRFEEELERGMDLLWEVAEASLGDAEQKELEAYSDEVGLAESWLLLDLPLGDQWTMLDRFLMERGDGLTDGQRNFLLDLRDTHLSLFEVQEVVEDKGVVGTDLWTGDRFRISCPDHWQSLAPWDLLVGRLLCRPDGTIMFEFGSYPFPAGTSVELLARLRQHHDWLLSYEPNLSARTFLKRVGFLFHHLMIEFRDGRRPSFLYPEGSLVHVRTYRCQDPEAAGLLLEQAHDSFVGVRRHHWVHRHRTSVALDSNAPQVRIFGHCLQTAGLEMMDLERLEERLQDLLPHSLELVEQCRSTIEGLDSIDLAQGSDPGRSLQALHEHVRMELERWLSTKRVEFEGQSPLECVGSPHSLDPVLDQVKAFENREYRHPLHPDGRYDFAWVWARLGTGTTST